jgi:hypothetical protein
MLHRQLLAPGTDRLRVPEELNPPFWAWYSGWRGEPGALRVDAVTADGPEFPEPTGRVALWYSRGMASAYTAHRIADLTPEVIRYEDVASTVGPHRAGAPLPFVLAVVSAHLGLSCAYLGVIRRMACGAPARLRAARPEADLGMEFLAGWNEYHPGHRLRTVCADLTRDRMLAALPPGAERELFSCERTPDGWCRDCAACFESYYAAKAVGRSLGFRLTARIFDQLYTREYCNYLASEFGSDPSNRLQFYVYLQMTYGLRFDRADDVA